MNELDANRFLKENRSLFHYTTAQGLLGIVQNRCLFATHADFSNDSSECKLIRPHLKRVLEEEFARLVPELVDIGVFNERLLGDYGRGAYALAADQCVDAMLRSVNNVAPYFITSFCIHNKADYEYSNGLLSQWRGYARGGFAIEFDEAEIDKWNEEEHAGWRYQGMLWNAVVYENHEAFIDPKRFIGMAGAFLREILHERPGLNEILGGKTVNDFARHFLEVAPFIKHFSFREESEYRIVAMCNRPSKFDEGGTRAIKEIHFRSRAGGNVLPYIALYEGLERVLPIKAVVIGPHAQQENQRAAVELLLERYGIQAEVRVSQTTFRD